mgnify:FL=1
MNLRPEHPISQLESSINNAENWIKNDIEHYLKGKGKSKTTHSLGASMLFGRDGILTEESKELIVLLEKEGLKERVLFKFIFL